MEIAALFPFILHLIIYNMQYTISQLKREVFSKVYEVYDIFQNFFGEEFTDLQNLPNDRQLERVLVDYEIDISNPDSYNISRSQLRRLKEFYALTKYAIMVWWPRVTVTNENNKSVVIQDLYAMIEVTLEGRIPYENRGFKLNRTTFSEIQFVSGYLHSHIPHFSGVPDFNNPCLGSGPINNTIMDLKNGFEDTVWMLFCQELSLYVTVESLKGGPYFRLETIGSRHDLIGFSDFTGSFNHLIELRSFQRNNDDRRFKEMLREFIKYYLENGHLSISYKNKSYQSGLSYFDYMIDISNAFIDFFNQSGNRNNLQELYDNRILVKAFAAENKFYRNNNRSSDNSSNLEGTEMFRFKGEVKTLHILRSSEDEMHETTLLHNDIALFILHSILRIINYRYKNEHNEQIGSNQAGASTTNQTVCYL